MGLFDKLRERLAPPRTGGPGYGNPSGYETYGTPTPAYGTPQAPPRGRGSEPRDPDEAAVERYRYMLRTAPPDTIEQAHAEAFARLTPQQRQQVLSELGSAVPAAERARSSDPRDLARMATRAEVRQPGFLERTFGGYGGGYGRPGMGGGMGGGIGMGGLIGGTLLGSIAGAFIGTAIADELFDSDGFGGGDGFLDNDGPFGGDGGDGGQAEAAADTGGYDDGGGFDGGGFDGGDFGGGDF